MFDSKNKTIHKGIFKMKNSVNINTIKDAAIYNSSLVGKPIFCLYVDDKGGVSVEAMTVGALHQLGSSCYLTAANRRKVAECLNIPRIMNDPCAICYVSDLDKWLHDVVCCYTSGRECYDAVDEKQTMICSVFYASSLDNLKNAILNF